MPGDSKGDVTPDGPFGPSDEGGLVAPGLQPVPCIAAFCTAPASNYSILQPHRDNRSKFNVPLQVEAQGFCVIR